MSEFQSNPGNDSALFGKRRKAYEPPRALSINLRPEEAVLGNCKTASVAGPVSFTCTTTGMCKTIGS